MYPQTKVWQRRRDVTTLLVRGYSRGEIAETLKTRTQTIDNDMQVIRSGKNKALFAHARKQIIVQLHLNAMERAKYLWRIIEEAEKHSVKVQALRELRLNDEHITAKLPEPGKDTMEEEEEEFDKEALRAQYQDLFDRVGYLQKRREGMQEAIRECVENGDMEGLRLWLADSPEPTAGDKDSQ